jgi:mRNA-degrading endonuclease RelE of RelBE toxin-antitoxin system
VRRRTFKEMQVMYRIDPDTRTVQTLRVDHRPDVYRR